MRFLRNESAPPDEPTHLLQRVSIRVRFMCYKTCSGKKSIGKSNRCESGKH